MPDNSISREMISMSELNSKKIVQHNDLIMSVARMEAIPLKFFELAVACLDTDNVPADRTVYVSKELLFSFFNAKSGNKHSKFKKALLELHKEAVFLMNELDEKSGIYEYRIISPLEETSWNDYKGEVSFKFTESIMPYLIELKSNFTQYLLADIGKLKSKYAIIIYKWLSMNYNQYEYYQVKGNRSEKQLESLTNPIISIRDLRKITDTEKIYEEMTDFTKRVLDDATSKITENTTFNVDYKKIKKGGRITAIQFFITKKQVVPNAFYKDEQQDPAYLQDKKDKEQEFETLYNNAMESDYTDLLGDNMLIGFKDIRDKEIMANLQRNVYTLYDELKQLVGMEGVRQHIRYVAEKKMDYSNKNIVKYLNVSANDYLTKIKNGTVPRRQMYNPVPEAGNKKSDKASYLYNWLEE